MVAVREPGAAARPLAHGVEQVGCLQDAGRQRARDGEVGPARRPLAQPTAPGPALGRRHDGLLPRACAFRHRVGRAHADHAAQQLAHLAEVEAGVEPLRQGEHVALGLRHRVPPALAVVVDDQHLAGAAPVLQAPPRAVGPVQAVAAPLQQQRAAHARPQLAQLRIASAHVRAPVSGGRAEPGPGGGRPPSPSLHPDPPPATDGAGRGARACAARERASATHPCGTARGGRR